MLLSNVLPVLFRFRVRFCATRYITTGHSGTMYSGHQQVMQLADMSSAPFTLRIATDIYGKKYNREFTFSEVPLVHDMINVVEGQYDAIGRSKRPPGYPDIPFQAQTFQMFDSLQEKWTDLYSSQQLVSGAQLYCFQPESIWHSDIQEGVPVSQRIKTWVSSGGRVLRMACDSGIPPSHSEKIRSTFAEADIGNKGFLIFNDMSQLLTRCEMQLTTATVEELFLEADTDGDGNISYEEWVAFCLDASNADLISGIYFRCKDMWSTRKGAASNQLQLVAARDAARLLEHENEAKWLKHRAIAQQNYEDARREAAIARQKASEAAEREHSTYSQLYG
eukprot:TRINITY_DN12734_c0_g1_i2.p1 TRINITY_DN12734_c0_g1~~TRINITY_DN12734_c0_g1_i2.p1  ORF type:complete len:335 (+),score=85.55 TRINITY_DN12734_c0_g1_i2:713-1717(+)